MNVPSTSRDHIIFVCEFGSKKSVLAASWFAKLAAERGVAVESVSRGITPDAEVPGRVRQALLSHGIDTGGLIPQQLVDADWANARIIVSFTEEPVEPVGDARVVSWADVPALSDDFDRASDQIFTRVQALVDELAADQEQQ